MRANRCMRLLLGATALTTLTALPAMAQDDGLFTRLGRIVLGVGGTDTVAIDTPQAVTVLNQDDIDGQQATTVGELFNLIPGVQAIGSGRIGGVSFNIRGIGEAAASDESKIIVTVDGAAKFYEQYRMGSFFSDPELFNRIEVLRGPASSTLYGSGALGGVINFETKDASDFVEQVGDHALRTRLQYQSNGDELMGSVIFATRPSETFETLVSLNYRQSDETEDGDGVALAGSEFASYSGLIKSSLYFGDSLDQSLTFSYTRWQSDLDDTAFNQINSGLGFGTVDRLTIDDTIAIRYENPVAGSDLLDLDVILSYSNTQVTQDNASYGFFCSPGTYQILCDTEYAYRTTSLKVENDFELGGDTWEGYVTAGLQLSHQDRVGESSIGPLGYHPEGTDNKLGLYAQGEFILNERLTLVPGLRVDVVSLEAGSGVAGASYDEVAISPKIAAHYEINDAWSIFGSLAQTQRMPTLDEIYSNDADSPYSPDLTMETANSVELGFATSQYGIYTDNDVVEFKATAFYSNITDMISRDSAVGTPYYENVDEAEIWGYELEAAYQSDRAFGSLAYSNIHGEDKTTGVTLSSIPAQTLNLRIGGRALEQSVEYGWSGNFVGEITTGGATYDSYVTHDLFVDYTVPQGALAGLEVGLVAKNVLDTMYTNSLVQTPGEGRSFGLSLTRSFEF